VSSLQLNIYLAPGVINSNPSPYQAVVNHYRPNDEDKNQEDNNDYYRSCQLFHLHLNCKSPFKKSKHYFPAKEKQLKVAVVVLSHK
jgi:hypothetical protein